MLFTQETRITFVSLVLRKRVGSSAGNFPLKSRERSGPVRAFCRSDGAKSALPDARVRKNYFLARDFFAFNARWFGSSLKDAEKSAPRVGWVLS